MAPRIDRKPPVHRQRIQVKGKTYDVLTHTLDASWPVLVASASQEGFWICWREDGCFKCACPAFLWRGKCSHTAAAIAADTALFPADVWPGPGEAQEYEAWLDSIDDGQPPDDEWEIDDPAGVRDLLVRR